MEGKPLFYKCRSCGEGYVTIYGLPCTRCRIDMDAKLEARKNLFWAGVLNVVMIVLPLAVIGWVLWKR